MNATCKVLVVDDNEPIRQLLKTKLNKCDFDVYCAENVLDAFYKFIEEPFDLVLTDICMPGLNGNHLASYIRNLDKETPIVAVTASPGLANEVFDAVIEKPFTLNYLLDTITYFLHDETDIPAGQTYQLCV
jgi:CheY-like chemotaxis protein